MTGLQVYTEERQVEYWYSSRYIYWDHKCTHVSKVQLEASSKVDHEGHTFHYHQHKFFLLEKGCRKNLYYSKTFPDMTWLYI